MDGFGVLELAEAPNRYSEEEQIREMGLVLNTYLDENDLRADRCILSLGREGIVTRTNRVPVMDLKLLSGFIDNEITEFLPVDVSEYRYDYKILRQFVSEDDGNEYYELLIGAVPHYMVQQTMMMAEMANVTVQAIDILPNAVLRLFSEAPYKDMAVIDVGTASTKLSIFDAGSLLLYSDIPFRIEDAEYGYGGLLEETRGYLNYFASRNQGRMPEALFVVGELTRPEYEEGLEFLRGGIEIPVIGHLESMFRLRFEGRAGGEFAQSAALYPANIGLILRRD